MKSGLINDDRFSSEEISSFEHDKKIKDVEYKNYDMLCDLMIKKLDNDKTLNPNLTSFEFDEISKSIKTYANSGDCLELN